MKSIYPIPVAVYLVFFLMSCGQNSQIRNWELSSPDGKVHVTVSLFSHPHRPEFTDSEKACLLYKVDYGSAENRLEWIGPSPLGIERTDQDFTGNLVFQSGGKIRNIETSYTMLTGKRQSCRNVCNEMELNFKNSDSAKIQVVFRAYNDGVAFQYRFPDTSAERKTVLKETTGFRVPLDGEAFIQPYEEPDTYKPAYEALYRSGVPVGTASSSRAGWAFPALFKLHGGRAWALLTETGLERTYCGSHLGPAPKGGLYTIRFPESKEGNGTGAADPSSVLPWALPWRVIVLGETQARILESTLATDLSPSARIETTDWIKPGRVSWSWWSDNGSPTDEKKLRTFVDLAAVMGWEYSLVDANWNRMAKEAIPDLVQYAAEKNVGILLWYNSGGPHNTVTEQPRDRMLESTARREEFSYLKAIGVKGVKVDFFQSDKQEVIGLYQDILEDAACFGLLVNFHGCTVPRGWARTYPNLMSMEAVRGAESYIFDPEYPAAAPRHNTILAFTRNAIGSMDYTPVTFSDNRYAHKTTDGHELALSVVFESGWVHFADRADAYLDLPPAPKSFLRRVPTRWDDVRFLTGEPGKYVVLARRAGEKWFIGGINGEDKAVTSEIKLRFLYAIPYTLRVINDGLHGKGFKSWEARVSAADSIAIPLQPFGGFVAELVPI